MSPEYRPAILGTGSAHPKVQISNEEVGKLVADYNRKQWEEEGMSEDQIQRKYEIRVKGIEKIAQRIGVESRWYCAEDESTSTIGIEASHNALEASGVKAAEVKGVILSTGLGDYMGTSTAAIIAKELGVPEEALTHDISAACVGFAHATYEAFTNLTSPMSLDGPILIVSSETISRGMHPSKKDTVPIFGDGAGAVVVGLVKTDSEQPWPFFVWGSNAEHLGKLVIQVGGSVEPVTPDTPDEKRGVTMDNKFVFQYATQQMIRAGENTQEGTRKFNELYGKSDERRRFLTPHQANILIIKEVQQGLAFTDDDSVVNIANWANTGSAAIPIALDEAIRKGEITEEDSVLGVTFGSGIVWAGFIIHLYGLGKKWVKYPHGKPITEITAA